MEVYVTHDDRGNVIAIAVPATDSDRKLSAEIAKMVSRIDIEKVDFDNEQALRILALLSTRWQRYLKGNFREAAAPLARLVKRER